MLIPFEKTKSHQRYKLKDGTTVPGGSTIAKIGDDPSALINWAWECGQDGLDYRKVRDEAADIGSLAHFILECELNNTTPNLSEFSEEVVKKAFVASNKALDFWKKEGLTLISAEKQLVSEKYRYGGTLDIIAKDNNGDCILIDWKSSKSIWDSHLCQLSAYENLWNEHCVEELNGQRSLIDKAIKRRAIIRIGKKLEGDFEVRWLGDMKDYFEVFKAQLNLYYAKKKLK